MIFKFLTNLFLIIMITISYCVLTVYLCKKMNNNKFIKKPDKVNGQVFVFII